MTASMTGATGQTITGAATVTVTMVITAGPAIVTADLTGPIAQIGRTDPTVRIARIGQAGQTGRIGQTDPIGQIDPIDRIDPIGRIATPTAEAGAVTGMIALPT